MCIRKFEVSFEVSSYKTLFMETVDQSLNNGLLCKNYTMGKAEKLYDCIKRDDEVFKVNIYSKLSAPPPPPRTVSFLVRKH